jgi:hypothetical protein
MGGNMADIKDVFLLPSIAEADYSIFRAALNCEGQGTSLPFTYQEWLTILASRRRERGQAGSVVCDIPIEVVQFADYCERHRIEQPTVITLDRFVAELARH